RGRAAGGIERKIVRRARLGQVDEFELERNAELSGDRAYLPGVGRGREAMEFHVGLLWLWVVWSKGRQHLAETIEDRGPTVAMTVARGFVEELLVGQREQGPVAVAFELDRHQRFALRRGPPGPGENELPVRHDLAERSAHVVLLAARRAHHDAIAAADTGVGLGQRQLECGRAEPPR